MIFTSEQEEAIIEENMPKIYRAIDNFTARCSKDVIRVPYEEYVQEVSLAFLLYIRKCETMDEVNRFPWFSAMNAMRSTVQLFQPMSCSRDPHSFSQIIHSMPSTVSTDLMASANTDVNGLSKHWVDDKDTMMDFESFMSDYDEGTQRLISMRFGGMTLQELADQYGVEKSTILRRIRNIAEEYHQFTDIPDEEG